MSKYENKYDSHTRICEELNVVYRFKNERYDDAFAKGIKEWGLTSAGIRLTDKLNRFKEMVKNPEIDAGDESIQDTLMDMANYCIMTLIEINEDYRELELQSTVKDFEILSEELNSYDLVTEQYGVKQCKYCVYYNKDSAIPCHDICKRCFGFDQYQVKK